MAPVALAAFGPFASPPGILVTLVVLAAVLFVGRFLLNLAWKLVVIGLIAVTTLWILGVLGFHFSAF